jgi:hypothetical protein
VLPLCRSKVERYRGARGVCLLMGLDSEARAEIDHLRDIVSFVMVATQVVHNICGCALSSNNASIAIAFLEAQVCVVPSRAYLRGDSPIPRRELEAQWFGI